MRITQFLQSSAVVSLSTILTMGHFRLREICAEQVRTIARYRKELARMAAAHKEILSELRLENDQLRESAAATHNRLEADFEHRIEVLFLRMADDRGIRFHEDATLDDMEEQLLKADRRSGQRVSIGSGHRIKNQQPRHAKETQKK